MGLTGRQGKGEICTMHIKRRHKEHLPRRSYIHEEPQYENEANDVDAYEPLPPKG